MNKATIKNKILEYMRLHALSLRTQGKSTRST